MSVNRVVVLLCDGALAHRNGTCRPLIRRLLPSRTRFLFSSQKIGALSRAFPESIMLRRILLSAFFGLGLSACYYAGPADVYPGPYYYPGYYSPYYYPGYYSPYFYGGYYWPYSYGGYYGPRYYGGRGYHYYGGHGPHYGGSYYRGRH
jgi:hypothetical protein